MRLAKATQLHREGARLMVEGRQDEAERHLRMALANLETGEDGIEFAAIAHDLGSLLAGRMEVDEAAALYERSLAARRRILGRDHPDVAATLHNWAVLCQSAGRLEEANVLWDQAGAILAAAPSVNELDVTETSTTGRTRLDAIQ
jgi:tetratricopeptide (TPR) repeat protein